MLSATWNLSSIAQTSAIQIVDCLIEGTLIAVFAWLVLGIARRQNSGTRFAVWFSALIAIASLPLFGGWLWPHVRNISGPGAITLPNSWAIYVIAAWAVVAAWLMLGVLRGLWHLHVLRQNCVPVDPAELDPRLQQTLEQNRGTRTVTLCTSCRVNVPTAIGFVKPTIVLPAWLMDDLTTEELNHILLHELAHLRRWDDWTNLAQKIVRAMFFFHPAVWWLEQRASLEREMACDDAVIEQTASPHAYAECLAHLAERTLLQRTMGLAQAALGKIRQTTLRVGRILDANRPAGRSWKPAVSVVAGFAVICVVGISRAPQLVAFSNGNTEAVGSRVMASSAPGAARSMPAGMVRATNAVFRPGPLPVTQARLQSAAHRNQNTDRSSEALHVASHRSTARDQGNIRLTRATAAPVPVVETVFMVFETSDSVASQPTWHIEFWHVTVLHTQVDPDSRVPRKEI